VFGIRALSVDTEAVRTTRTGQGGAEVGVYHRMPGRARPSLKTLSPFLPNALAALIIKGIFDGLPARLQD
jgi:hypothetical protein